MKSVKFENIMNKSTNNYRRCSYCPHEQYKKACCCQGRQSVHQIKTKTNSRIKSRSKKTINVNKSNMSYINNTLPIVNNSALSHLSSNMMVQNSILRTENDYLKKQLHSQYQVSSFMKDDRNQSTTLNTSQNQTSRTNPYLDKLFYSNRNLQQALAQLDSVSKQNAALHQLNTKLTLQKQQLNIKNQQFYQQTIKLKKKMKKLHKQIDQLPNQQQVHRLIQDNQKLEEQKNYLQQINSQLREELRRFNNTRTVVQMDNLSPEWVANTSTKINAIQRNISKLQEQNKQNVFTYNNTFVTKQLTKQVEQQVGTIKKQIISAIKILKLQSQSFKFGSSAFDQMINNCNSNIMVLIKSLCQSLLQPLQMKYIEIFKDIDRKLKLHENKFIKVVQKMDNMIIKVQNDKLKQMNRGRMHF